MSRTTIKTILLFTSLFCVYFACRNYHPIGWINDDARHILSAKAILAGTYRHIFAPGSPPITNLLPGYPLLIAPAVATGYFWPIQALSAAFTAGAIVLVMFYIGGATGILTALLLAFNPLTLELSSTAMSEPAFLFWTMACLFLHGKFPDRKHALILLLSAFSAWIRPHGFILFIAILMDRIALIGAKRIAPAALPAILLALLPFIRNLFLSGTPATYFQELPSGTAISNIIQLLGTLWENARYYLFGLPESVTGFFHPLALLIWPVFIWGASQMKSPVQRLRLKYLCATILLHLFWVNHDTRYILPVLPICLEILLAPFAGKSGQLKHWQIGIAFVILAIYSQKSIGIISASQMTENHSVMPTETITWIKNETPKNAVFMATFPESTSLLTSRISSGLISDPNPDRWYKKLLDKGIEYVWEDNSRTLIASVSAKRGPLAATIQANHDRFRDRARFREIFRSEDMKQVIYKATPPINFNKHYIDLEKALSRIDRNDLDAALKDLKGLRTGRSGLIRLDFYIGTTELLKGNSKGAIPYLETAAHIEPDFRQALLNLCRAYRASGAPANSKCAE